MNNDTYENSSTGNGKCYSHYQNDFFMMDEIDDELAAAFCQFVYWKIATRQPFITVHLSSHGGSVTSMLVIIGAINDVQVLGAAWNMIVKVDVMGMALSAGGIIAAAGTPGYRQARTESYFMVHDLSTYIGWSNLKGLKDDTKTLKMIRKPIIYLLSRFTGKPIEDITRDLDDGKDRYMSASAAKNYGLIDIVTKWDDNKDVREKISRKVVEQ